MNQHGLIPIMQKKRLLNVLPPCEKVRKVFHLFRMILEELERDKAAHFATNKTYLDAQAIIIREGKQVNGEKMVGIVPGVEVGNEFQFKVELNIIGLHFYLSGGIDFMNIEGLDLATSVVASEGTGYNDIFDSNVVIYCGEGMCLKSKNPKVIEDQKMTKGNLSLVNSMITKSPVRVISGRKRMNQKRKQYVYEGLYLVKRYWEEQGPLGNNVFKFKLQRLPGQASIH
ncbi:unnamed protein product [Arabis nemorensis]|uniref:YDG domain-containing protein n=1 Tax=Arabis nemorensis TaxID=586526 RepID=A0A565CAN8_9BRAS|nr:unnamed protein product [Arabis nemorensis]